MAEQQVWEPKATREQTKETVMKYRSNSQLWDDKDDEIKELEKHARAYRIPFARSETHQENAIMRALSQFGKGWGEGFSANIYQSDEEPENTTEAIARNLGHLAGFVGYIPGGKVSKTLKALNTLTSGRSVPLLASKKVNKVAGKMMKPMVQQHPRLDKLFADNTITGDAFRGAMHLGVASTVADWRGIVDEGGERALEAFGFGGMFGAGFRTLGNMRGFGEVLAANQIGANGRPILKMLKPGQKADLALRTIAGGFMQNLPAGNDQATEEMVYNYLLGAFFGYGETPLQTRISKRAISEAFKEGHTLDGVPDPELNANWDKWTKTQQQAVKKDFDHVFGETTENKALSYHVMKKAMENGEIKMEDIIEAGEKYREGKDISPDGEVFADLSPTEIKKAQEFVKENPNLEDYQDLDMHINDVSALPGRIAGENGYVERYIRPVVERTSKEEWSVPKRLNEAIKIEKKWNSLHKPENGVQKPVKGALKKMYKFLYKEYGKGINEGEMDWWRNWAEQTRKKEPVLQPYTLDGEFTFVDRGVNGIGNKKDLAFEPPFIQKNWQSLIIAERGLARDPDAPIMTDKPFYAMFNHIVRKGKEFNVNDTEGLTQQIAGEIVKRVPNAPEKQIQREAREKAEAYSKRQKTLVMEKMDEMGYYYTGGKGDKNAMYFIQRHPFLKSGEGLQEQLKMVKEAFKTAGIKDADKIDDYIAYNRRRFSLKNYGLKKSGRAEDYWVESYVSNALYEVHNNLGFKITREQMPSALVKVLGSGYINTAKAYNKRAQIWFNTGLSTNEAYAQHFLKQYNGVPGYKKVKLVELKNGKFKLGVFDDFVKASKKADRENLKRPESFDGGIPALPEFIYALNKSVGISNEGNVNKSFIVSPDPTHGALLGKYMFFEASAPLQKMMRKKGIHALAPASAIKQMGDRKFGQVIKPGEMAQARPLYEKEFNNAMAELARKSGFMFKPATSKQGFEWEKRIGEIFFPEGKRGHGEGTKFYNMWERFKRTQGDSHIIVDAFDSKDPKISSIGFWRKQGFRYDPRKERKGAHNVSFPKDYGDRGVTGEFNKDLAGKTVRRVPMIKMLTPLSKKVSPDFNYEGPLYDVPVSHVRTILSEITDAHMIDPALFPKQMWSTITHFGKNPTDPATTRAMADYLITRSVMGSEKVNDAWLEHLKSPNPISEKYLLDNIHNASLANITKTILDTNNEPLAAKLYNKILKMNSEFERIMAEEAEMSRQEIEESRKMNENFDGIIDRVAGLYPEQNLGPYLHKFSKGHRFTAMRNYIVNRIARPRIENSGTARMRPWDAGMQVDPVLKRLNKEQDIFFLDNSWKNKLIYDDFFKGGKEKLGNIWTEYQKGKKGRYRDNLELVEDILETTAMRVPMDSQSGAHILKFAGFTGVRGYGVMLHGRVMEALGGADLDGDKAFLFFGGQQGMHKEWKEIYRGQKDEFVKKTDMTPAKTKEARDLFVETNAEVEKYGESPLAQFDPNWRGHMSEAAAGGRDTLGGAVTARQAMLGAYDALRLAPEKQFFGESTFIRGKFMPKVIQDGSYYLPVDIVNKDGKFTGYYYLRMKATDDPKRIQKFKELSRAAINLGADPMDESGIVGLPKIKEILKDQLFDYSIVKSYQKKEGDGKIEFFDSPGFSKQLGKRLNYLKRFDLTMDFARANNVLYGRDFKSGRKWNLGDIQEGIHGINWLPKESQNTLLPFLAKEVKQVIFEDNLIRRIDPHTLNELYEANRVGVGKDEDLKELFERTSMMTRQGKLLENVIKNELFSQAGRIRLARNKERFWDLFTQKWYPQFVNRFKKDKRTDRFIKQTDFYEMGEIPYHLMNTFFSKGKDTSFRERMQYLENKANVAEDFLVNDLSDMAGLSYILKVKEKGNVSKDRFQEINKMVEKVKNDSYWIRKQREELQAELKEQAFSEEQLNEAEKLGLKELLSGEKLSAGDDKAKTDRKIIADKKKLKDPNEKKLYDALMLGTFSRTNLKELNRLRELMKSGKPMKGSEIWLKNILEKHGQNTSLLRLGFEAKAISDVSIREYFGEYNKLFKKIKQHDPEQQEYVVENAKIQEKDPEYKKVTTFRDETGDPPRGAIIESSELDASSKRYLDEIAPLEGLHDGKLSPRGRELYYSIQNHLRHYHNLDSTNLNGWFRDLFKKNINQANLNDMEVLDNFFKDMRRGSAWSHMWDKLLGKPKHPDIKRSYWNIFPRAIERDMLKTPAMMEWRKDIGPYKDRFNNSIMGRIVRPTAVIGDLQNYAHKMGEFSIQQHEMGIADLRDELAPYTKALPQGDQLHKLAVVVRERMMKHLIAEAEGNDGRLLNHKQMSYELNYKEMKPFYDQIKGKTFTIPKKDGAVTLTGEQIIKDINAIYTRQNKKIEKWINGDQPFIEKWLDKSVNDKGQLTWAGVDKLRKDFIEYSREKFRKGEKYDIERFGLYGMNEISKRILLSLTPNNPKVRTLKELIRRQKIYQLNSGKTPLWAPEAYYPHIAFDRGKVEKYLEAALKQVWADPKLTKKEKKEYVNKLIYQSKAMTGDWVAKDQLEGHYKEMAEHYTEIAKKQKGKQKFILPKSLNKAFSQHQRDSHMRGWSTDPEAYEGYMKNISDSFYKSIMQILSRTHIQQFHQKFFKQTNDPALSRRWDNFLQLFTQSAMGHPIEIPEAVQKDPLMKISLTPYKWFSDNNTRKRIDSIRKTLGIGRKALKDYNLDEATLDELTGLHQSRLQAWGSLEAKWQMASLLAHPKSSITNLYGGTIHTAIGAGIRNLRNARNIDYLRSHVNPEWRSMKDVNRWVEGLGIVEEYLIHEAGLNRKIRGKRWDDFIKDASKRLARDPEMSDTSLNQLRKKYKVTDSMWNLASTFMRKPERILRRDAFMAHYLQARENFKGAIRDFNHPFLIEMGKRGVKGTQFLYSAPYRPMWTNSTLGRVFSRFQLWSWNSVRFRNDVLREARLRGLQQGTPEFDRARRMMTADLFMKTMASMFTYSLFDNALPAPWNWFQDTADWLMGDEKERERAFYGSPLGPASIVQPPLLRFITPTFEGLVNGDWSQMTDYYAYTLLPFGRLIKDVAGPGGIVENPFYTMEKMTGFPLIAGGRQIQKAKEGSTPATRSPYGAFIEGEDDD